MTTATEASVETKASAPVAASAPAAPAAPSGQPAGVVAPTIAAAAPAAPAAPAEPAAKAGLLAETPAAPAVADAKPAAVADAKPVEITLKAPEGQTIDDATLRAVESFAKDAGLSQKQAEAILARETKGRSEAETAWKAAQTAEVSKVADTWRAEAEKHPEIGGDKLPAAIEGAKRALAAYATPEERKAIADSPFANNPMFIAIMSRAAKGLPAEDKVHAGAASGGKSHETDPVNVLYPMYRSKA